jgi:tagatose 1,6-diphosphate aldolase
MSNFSFFDFSHQLIGERIELILDKTVKAIPEKNYVPAYFFHIRLKDTKENIGKADIRIGYTEDLVRFGGQIGYRIFEQFRGHSYAVEACNLLKIVAQKHHMDVIWITCDENNSASKRVLQKLGCSEVELINLPESHDLYKNGQRKVWRYRLIVYPQ